MSLLVETTSSKYSDGCAKERNKIYIHQRRLPLQHTSKTFKVDSHKLKLGSNTSAKRFKEWNSAGQS